MRLFKLAGGRKEGVVSWNSGDIIVLVTEGDNSLWVDESDDELPEDELNVE